MNAPPQELVLRHRTLRGRSIGPKSGQGQASAEAVWHQGEEVLEMEQNMRCKARRCQRNINRQKEAALVVQNKHWEPRSLVLGLALCAYAQADNIVICMIIIMVYWDLL